MAPKPESERSASLSKHYAERYPDGGDDDEVHNYESGRVELELSN